MQLSPKAAAIRAALEARDPAPRLAPSGTWRTDAFDDLAACADPNVLAEAPERAGMARAVRSGLLLWNDSLDLAHALAMSEGEADKLTGQTLDYWHAIMHRREPDYPNSGYWFRRVGAHPAFPAVLAGAKAAVAASGCGENDEARQFVDDSDEWDAFGFVALCEKHEATTGATNDLVRAIQVAEIRALLDFSVAHAGSAPGVL